MKKNRFLLIYVLVCCIFYVPNVMAETCVSILGPQLSKFVADTYYMICYIGIALSVILGFMDFFKVFAGGEKSELKTVAGKLVKRLIAIAILLIFPSILKWIFDAVGVSFDTCGV